MDILWGILLVSWGVILGVTITSMVMRWVLLVAETLKSPTPHPKRTAVLISLFHAGPWTLVVVGLFVYFVHSKAWAQLLGAGMLIWAVIFAVIAYRIRARKQARDAQNAA
jgi:hypothetical protein